MSLFPVKMVGDETPFFLHFLVQHLILCGLKAQMLLSLHIDSRPLWRVLFSYQTASWVSRSSHHCPKPEFSEPISIALQKYCEAREATTSIAPDAACVGDGREGEVLGNQTHGLFKLFPSHHSHPSGPHRNPWKQPPSVLSSRKRHTQ